MINNSVVKSVIKNKIFLYVFTRYFVYGLQFVILMLVASKLGPYYYGVWGFILMLIGYFSICNFGIANSISVLIVQYKDNSKRVSDYVASALVCVGLMSLVVIIVGIIVPLCNFDFLAKYNIGKIFYAICLYAIVDYFNRLFCYIYRAQNRLIELTFYQSSTPVLVLCVLFVFSGDALLYALFFVYLLAQLLSLFFFLIRGAIPYGGHASIRDICHVFKKGLFLFLYNACFYLILVSTSTIISYYYTITEYGFYTFSYNLGHAVLLVLDALAFILFPKMLDKFFGGNNEMVLRTIKMIRANYVVLTHGIMYLAFAAFPFFILLFPQYKDALMALWFTALSVMMTVNSFGFNTFLIARNKELLIAKISLSCLFCNIFMGLLLAYLKVPYYMIVLSVLISYILFAVTCCFYALRELDLKVSLPSLIKEVLPTYLLFPFIAALIVAMLGVKLFSFVPALLFFLLNSSNLKSILLTINNIRKNPAMADISKE